jgi:hypothetical protein
MSLIGKKGEERQQILRQHLDIQKELELVRIENKSLKEVNSQLKEQLEIREVDFQNLFSYVQEIQAACTN